MRPKPVLSGRAGYTVVEAMVSVLLLTFIFFGFTMVVHAARRQQREGMLGLEVERTGERVLDRIVDLLRYSDGTSFFPDPNQPLSTSALDFQLVEGYGAGAAVLSGPQKLELDPSGRIVWTQDPGLAGEQSVVWVSGVPGLLEGELPNGVDDNGNGLVDEPGLCFTRAGKVVVVRFTLTKETPGGTNYVRTFESRIHPRN